MNTYQVAVQGSTEGKVLSRQHVNEAIVEMVEKLGLTTLKGVSLPSTAAKQETDLQAIMQAKGVNSKITCIEQDQQTFFQVAKPEWFGKESILPQGVRMVNNTFGKAIKKINKADWFWFDACGDCLLRTGYKGSHLNEFVNATKHSLGDKGVSFFTARITSRTFNANDLHELMTGKRLDKFSNDAMVAMYLDIVNRELPDCNVFYELQYPSSSRPFIVIGVAKGWKPKKKVINLIPIKEKKKMDKPLIQKVISLTSQGKNSVAIGSEVGKTASQVGAIKAHLGMGTYGEPYTSRYGKAVVKLDKVETNALATNMLARGKSTEQILNKTNLSTMQLAGIKASISRKANANA